MRQITETIGLKPPFETAKIPKDLVGIITILVLRNVKFASGIKNFNFGFCPYTNVCLHYIVITYPSPEKKYHRHVTTTLAVLEQCLTN